MCQPWVPPLWLVLQLGQAAAGAVDWVGAHVGFAFRSERGVWKEKLDLVMENFLLSGKCQVRLRQQMP